MRRGISRTFNNLSQKAGQSTNEKAPFARSSTFKCNNNHTLTWKSFLLLPTSLLLTVVAMKKAAVGGGPNHPRRKTVLAVAGGQREAGCSSDVCYHPVSSTRLHTSTGEPVPLPLLFPSALLESAQEHPKAAPDFYRTKTVTAPRHYKTGVHLDGHVHGVHVQLFSSVWLVD